MTKILLLVLLIVSFCAPLFAQNNEGLKIGDTTWTFNGEIRFMYTDQTNPENYAISLLPSGDKSGDIFNRMYQRYRFGVTGSLNDRLSAHFELQVGDEQWGNKNYNEREINLRTLYAYLQFRPEFLGDNTTFKVGLQGYDDIFQYSIFSDEAVGIIVSQSMDTFTANIGYLSLRDDDVDIGIDPGPDPDGIVTCADTFFLTDMSYRFTDAFTVKAAFYYDYLSNLPPGESVMYKYNMAFYGIGADYQLNDAVSFGGHFVMRNGSFRVIVGEDEAMRFDHDGFFGYAYGSYSNDKFSAKLNFGYTPFKMEIPAVPGEAYQITGWGGGFALVDGINSLPYSIGGDQWQTAYGLEYYGRGDVCDRQAVNGGYGSFLGLMVVSANLSYDFIFANIGILRATDTSDMFSNVERSIGTEIDLGIKTDIMKDLEFKAVYAMFLAGDIYGADPDNGREMSMLLRYKF